MLISPPFRKFNEKTWQQRLAQIFLRPHFLNGCIIYDSACWLQKVTVSSPQTSYISLWVLRVVLFHISWFAININSYSPSFVNDREPQRYAGIQLGMCALMCLCVCMCLSDVQRVGPNSQCTVAYECFLIESIPLFQSS